MSRPFNRVSYLILAQHVPFDNRSLSDRRLRGLRSLHGDHDVLALHERTPPHLSLVTDRHETLRLSPRRRHLRRRQLLHSPGRGRRPHGDHRVLVRHRRPLCPAAGRRGDIGRFSPAGDRSHSIAVGDGLHVFVVRGLVAGPDPCQRLTSWSGQWSFVGGCFGGRGGRLIGGHNAHTG